jgi:hypothetical protein
MTPYSSWSCTIIATQPFESSIFLLDETFLLYETLWCRSCLSEQHGRGVYNLMTCQLMQCDSIWSPAKHTSKNPQVGSVPKQCWASYWHVKKQCSICIWLFLQEASRDKIWICEYRKIHLCSLSCMIRRQMRMFYFHTANLWKLVWPRRWGASFKYSWIHRGCRFATVATA